MLLNDCLGPPLYLGTITQVISYFKLARTVCTMSQPKRRPIPICPRTPAHSLPFHELCNYFKQVTTHREQKSAWPNQFHTHRLKMSSSSPPHPQYSLGKPLIFRNCVLLRPETPPKYPEYGSLQRISRRDGVSQARNGFRSIEPKCSNQPSCSLSPNF